MLDSLEDLRSAGFSGFESVKSLRESRLAAVPESAGMYLILCLTQRPVSLQPGPAGWYKGRDPTVPESFLREERVQGARVVYVVKASTCLPSRLGAYLSRGAGRRAAHWDGRFVWQVAESSSLLVAWRVELRRSPREVERELILQSEARHGRRPFANRVR